MTLVNLIFKKEAYMNSNVLELKTLIDGYRLACLTESKSPKTLEYYMNFLRSLGIPPLI